MNDYKYTQQKCIVSYFTPSATLMQSRHTNLVGKKYIPLVINFTMGIWRGHLGSLKVVEMKGRMAGKRNFSKDDLEVSGPQVPSALEQ